MTLKKLISYIPKPKLLPVFDMSYRPQNPLTLQMALRSRLLRVQHDSIDTKTLDTLNLEFDRAGLNNTSHHQGLIVRTNTLQFRLDYEPIIPTPPDPLAPLFKRRKQCIATSHTQFDTILSTRKIDWDILFLWARHWVAPVVMTGTHPLPDYLQSADQFAKAIISSTKTTIDLTWSLDTALNEQELNNILSSTTYLLAEAAKHPDVLSVAKVSEYLASFHRAQSKLVSLSSKTRLIRYIHTREKPDPKGGLTPSQIDIAYKFGMGQFYTIPLLGTSRVGLGVKEEWTPARDVGIEIRTEDIPELSGSFALIGPIATQIIYGDQAAGGYVQVLPMPRMLKNFRARASLQRTSKQDCGIFLTPFKSPEKEKESLKPTPALYQPALAKRLLAFSSDSSSASEVEDDLDSFPLPDLSGRSSESASEVEEDIRSNESESGADLAQGINSRKRKHFNRLKHADIDGESDDSDDNIDPKSCTKNKRAKQYLRSPKASERTPERHPLHRDFAQRLSLATPIAPGHHAHGRRPRINRKLTELT